MPSRFLCRFCPRSFKRQVHRNRYMATNHHELLQAFRETIDDAIELLIILSSVEQPDELKVENPYINKNEDQHQEQRTTPSTTCKVEIFLDASSSKGVLSSFEEYA